MKGLFRIAIVVCVVGMAVPAAADERGFYVGLGLGFPSYSLEDFAPDAPDLRFESDSFGFRAFGGYRLFTNLGFELGYQDLGRIKQWETDANRNDLKTEVAIDALDLSVLGIVSMGKRASGFVKLGAAAWNTDVTYRDDDEVDKLKDDGIGIAYGLGVDFFFKKTGLRLEGAWMDVSDAGTTFMLIGSVTVNF
ncbi:MAG: outer membrane beta-barrel protein [Thermoanaerobaculales bacterium]|nr:outer membrane beta-barrel protein [Thermoanaerobaculales bacterium]